MADITYNAPAIMLQIPDIKQMYEINEGQCTDLDNAVDSLDDNIFLDDMDAATCTRWETILNIAPLSTDTLEGRRFKIKSRILEKLPYSYRAIINRLDALCPDGYTLTINDDRTVVTCKLALKSAELMNDAKKLLERVLPLNMIYTVEILYNQYSTLESYTHTQLASYTYDGIRSMS